VRISSAILVTGGLLAAAFATGCTGNAEASGDRKEDHARLEIKGPSKTEFSGSCTVGDKEPEEIGGQVPKTFTYSLHGRPLDCEISSDGDLQVDLTVGENVHAVQRISGGNLNLTYENGSVSSVVSSSSESGGQGSSLSSGVISSVETSSVETPGQEFSDKTNDPGNVTRESRNVSGFDEVELKGVGHLSIQQTGSESLTVKAEADVLLKIRTEVENDRLILGLKPNTTIHTTEPISYKVTVKDLNALEVSGTANVDAENISTGELVIAISGTGNVKMSGEADSQQLDISGSGNYQAEDLKSKEARIDVGGSGSAIVNVRDELDADVSGSGSVEYVGDPAVNQDVSGVGRVSKH
jgi:Putative auto-transporter adhesin, head GIN domain